MSDVTHDIQGLNPSQKNINNVQIDLDSKNKLAGKKQSKLREMPSLEENLGDIDDMETSKPLTYEQLRQKAEDRLVSNFLQRFTNSLEKRRSSVEQPEVKK